MNIGEFIILMVILVIGFAVSCAQGWERGVEAETERACAFLLDSVATSPADSLRFTRHFECHLGKP